MLLRAKQAQIDKKLNVSCYKTTSKKYKLDKCMKHNFYYLKLKIKKTRPLALSQISSTIFDPFDRAIVRQELWMVNLYQGTGIAILVVVIIMSPSLIFLVRNATLTLQVTMAPTV